LLRKQIQFFHFSIFALFARGELLFFVILRLFDGIFSNIPAATSRQLILNYATTTADVKKIKTNKKCLLGQLHQIVAIWLPCTDVYVDPSRHRPRSI
jgi:hypothetical protein